jgi:hypothetical protein
MILGGPGSGKTFLAKQLKMAADAEFREYNLSQCHDPSEICQCFVDAANFLQANPGKNLLVFLDEFDVRINGIAAIQYLIQPMYDGTIRIRGTELEFRRAAFLFSGSYLKERRVFDNIAGGEQIDLARILFDAYQTTSAHGKLLNYRNQIWQDLIAVSAYDPVRQRMTPGQDVIAYVRSLEKIVDFVSRINGFVLELRNLGTPLHATRNRYRIELESGPTSRLVGKSHEFLDPGDSAAVAPDPQIAAQLIALVDGLRQGNVAERFYAYPDPQQPILEYKNLLLTDRLARVADMLKRTHGSKLRISRSLLNYLVMAPLMHSMRSLMNVVESLTNERDVVKMPSDSSILQRNIARFHEFDNADAVWARLRRHNPVWDNNRRLHQQGDELLSIV